MPLSTCHHHSLSAFPSFSSLKRGVGGQPEALEGFLECPCRLAQWSGHELTARAQWGPWASTGPLGISQFLFRGLSHPQRWLFCGLWQQPAIEDTAQVGSQAALGSPRPVFFSLAKRVASCLCLGIHTCKTGVSPCPSAWPGVLREAPWANVASLCCAVGLGGGVGKGPTVHMRPWSTGGFSTCLHLVVACIPGMRWHEIT